MVCWNPNFDLTLVNTNLVGSAKKSNYAGLAEEIGFSALNLCSLPWLVKAARQLCTSRKECNKLDLTVAQYFWSVDHNDWSCGLLLVVPTKYAVPVTVLLVGLPKKIKAKLRHLILLSRMTYGITGGDALTCSIGLWVSLWTLCPEKLRQKEETKVPSLSFFCIHCLWEKKEIMEGGIWVITSGIFFAIKNIWKKIPKVTQISTSRKNTFLQKKLKNLSKK